MRETQFRRGHNNSKEGGIEMFKCPEHLESSPMKTNELIVTNSLTKHPLNCRGYGSENVYSFLTLSLR